MNIFFVDRNPVAAAQMLCDKHIVKMALETAQILSTISGGPYKPTHQKHPSVLWAATQPMWTYHHFRALLDEYDYRFCKRHKCNDILPLLPAFAEHSEEWTDPPQCMPDEFKQTDTVAAYRAYYRGAKAGIAQWRNGRPAPDWFTNFTE